jgi:hypothetical protein
MDALRQSDRCIVPTKSPNKPATAGAEGTEGRRRRKGKVDNLLAGVGIHAGAHHNRIGGVNPGEGNLISNNRWNGVDIRDTGTSFNEVLGNRIGTDWTGTEMLGGLIDGVQISNGATIVPTRTGVACSIQPTTAPTRRKNSILNPSRSTAWCSSSIWR